MDELKHDLRDLLAGFAKLPLKRIDFLAADFYGYELEKIAKQWKTICQTDIGTTYPDFESLTDALWHWRPEEEKDEATRRELAALAQRIVKQIDLAS